MTLTCSCSWLAAQEGRLVGSYGDIRSATCTGINSFDTHEVLSDLANDYVVIRFSRSLEPLGALVPIVHKRLHAGMQAAGFADSTIQITAPATQKYLNISVTEGTRRRWVGMDLPEDDKVLPKTFLEQFLTRPLFKESGLPVSKEKAAAIAKIPKKERDTDTYTKPHLEVGDWANFSAGYLAMLQRSLERHCKAFGFVACDVQISSVAQADGAILKIRFQTDLERQAIASIDIDDNIRNTDEEVLAFIEQQGMTVGKFLTPRMVSATRTALRDSGRFLLPRITINGSDAGPTVHISVHDHAKLPRLKEELNDIQKAAMSIRHWFLNEFEQSGYGWRLNSEHDNGSQFTLAFHLGGELLIEGEIVDSELPRTYPFSSLVSDSQFHWRTPTRHLLMGNKESKPLVMRVNLALTAQLPDEKDNVGSISINLGYSTADQEKENISMLHTKLAADPAALLTLFHAEEWSMTSTDTITELKLPKNAERPHDAVVRYDTTTGRPILIKLYNDDVEGHISFSTYKADNLKRTTSFTTPTQQIVDRWTAAQLLGSDALAAVLDIMNQRAPEKREDKHDDHVALLNKAQAALPVAIMVYKTILEKSEAFNERQRQGNDDKKFGLPSDPDYPMGSNDMFGIIAGSIRDGASEFWHSDTWPMQLLQETQAVLARQEPNVVGKVARILRDPRAGPIACLTTAYLLKLGNIRVYDRVAKAGLGRVNPRGVYVDLAVLAGKHETISSIIAGIPHGDVFLALAPADQRERLQLLYKRCTEAKTAKEHEQASRYAAAMFTQMGLETKLKDWLLEMANANVQTH